LEGIVFHTKSRTEQLADHSAHLAGTAASVAEQLRERVVPAVGQAAESAKEWGQPRVEAARHWAKPRVEHGIEVAAPKLESAVSGIAPKVDSARDKIVDDLLPRLTEAIAAFSAASAAAKDEAVARGTGAAAVISGDAVASPKHKKKGRVVLLALGVLAVAAAAAAAFMKRPAPKDDPWATPLADPYVAPTTGRHFGVAADGDTAGVDADADAAADADAGSAEAKSVVSDSSEETDGPGPLNLVGDVDLAEKDDTDEGARA
jgi:hypothetical protein